MDNQLPNEVLIKIYEQFSDIKADIAATKTGTEANSYRLDMLMKRFDDIESDVKNLSRQEAKNAIKWGILTFAATTLLVTGMNFAIGKEVPQLTALPPTAKEILQDSLWDDNDNESYPVH